MNPAAAFFDRLAPRYDETWTNTAIGRAQRDAVWRELDSLIHPGARVLDLGCGTGEDAVHFQQSGAVVQAIDASAGMVAAARGKGVDTRQMRIEDVARLAAAESFDLILSNFGALNCVRSLSPLRLPLARMLRPGGILAVCLMNRVCFWETVRYTLRGDLHRATRRWSGFSRSSSGMIPVFYPSAGQVREAFQPSLDVLRDLGIGCVVPPSYVGMGDKTVRRLAKIDEHLAVTPARHVADHRLLLFRRAESA